MRRAAKVDANQAEIVGALRDIGYSVAITSQLGGGFPDLVIGGIDRRTGLITNWLAEVKDGDKEPARRRLTEDEAAWHAAWGGQVDILETVDDALRMVGVL